MSSSEVAAHITANATFTIGIIAATSAMLFSFVFPKMFDYINNRNTNILKELIEIKKSLPEGHDDTSKFDELIEFRRKRYLKKQIKLYRVLKNDDEIKWLQLPWYGSIQLLLTGKKSIKPNQEQLLCLLALLIGLLSIVAIISGGIALGQKIWPIK